jgi:hypothetical protein
MRPLIPAIVQRAFVATLTRDAYRDRAGRYRLRSRGGQLAPWNLAIRALYPNRGICIARPPAGWSYGMPCRWRGLPLHFDGTGKDEQPCCDL